MTTMMTMTISMDTKDGDGQEDNQVRDLGQEEDTEEADMEEAVANFKWMILH